MKFRLIIIVLISLFSGSTCLGQSDSSGMFKSFDGLNIHYEIMGHGRSVLLIHGFTGQGKDWKMKPVADSLIRNNFRVIMVDLRGNGLSGKPTTAEGYANNAEAKDLEGLMNFLGEGSYDAVGYSRGSIILASLMITDKHCKRAVIGGMGADFTNPEWPRRIAFYNALKGSDTTGFSGFLSYAEAKKLDLRQLTYQQDKQPSSSREQLMNITQETLVICGTEDHDNGNGSDLAALIPGAKFVEVPGTHNLTWGTTAYASSVLQFLKNDNDSRD